MLRLLRKKGQNTMEYAIVIGLVITAAMAMQTYVKRGWQARVKTETDYYGQKISTDPNWSGIWAGLPTGYSQPMPTLEVQYEPTFISSQQTRVDNSTVTDSLGVGGTVSRDIYESTGAAVGDYRRNEAP